MGNLKHTLALLFTTPAQFISFFLWSKKISDYLTLNIKPIPQASELARAKLIQHGLNKTPEQFIIDFSVLRNLITLINFSE